MELKIHTIQGPIQGNFFTRQGKSREIRQLPTLAQRRNYIYNTYIYIYIYIYIFNKEAIKDYLNKIGLLLRFCGEWIINNLRITGDSVLLIVIIVVVNKCNQLLYIIDDIFQLSFKCNTDGVTQLSSNITFRQIPLTVALINSSHGNY